MKKLIICILFISLSTRAIEIDSWADSDGDRRNTILEVSCNGNSYKLIVKKKDLNNELVTEEVISKWFENIKNNKCKEK